LVEKKPCKEAIWAPAHIVTTSQDMDVDNDLGDVAESEKADPSLKAPEK
jgi:hypothetical protein